MKNKKFWLVTSAVTLLPILAGLLLWDRLPDKLPTHFSIDGTADGWSGKGFAVFGLPLMFLAFQGIICGATLLDKQNQGHNRKVLDLVGLIFPAMSVFFSLVIYSRGMGVELDFARYLFLLLGLLFLLMGNWLPKIRQNATLGIKLKWTLYNEENWNRTHRFGGWCWCLGGIVFCAMGFLPEQALVWLLPANLILLIVLPTVYSWHLAKKQQAAGTYTESDVSKKLKQHPVLQIVSLVLVAVILVFVGVVMFTGRIEYTCTDTALIIEADFWEDSTVPYDQIDQVTYGGTAPAGTREWGFASAKLLMGYFSNDLFGGHTRYSYTGTQAQIIVTCGDDILVLNAETEEATKALFEELLLRLEENAR